MKKENYKTMEEIMNSVPDRVQHFRSAAQLASLALTKFAEQITGKGATILSCSPKQIKLDNGDIVKVVGMFLKYTYDLHYVYYIQFDSNPFFTPKGYITDNRGKSTGLTELPTIFDEVNEYSVDDKNIGQLTKNIFTSEEYMKNLSFLFKDNSSDLKQHIFYI